MKLFVAVMFSALTLPASAQVLLESLESHQKDIKPVVNSQNENGEPVKVDPVVKTKTSGECNAETQSSLPLRYITSLIQEKDGKLDIKHDPRTGKISVSSADMISNCNSMIEWTPDARVVDGRKVYSLEARIKKGQNCQTVDKKEICEYPVVKVENSQFKEKVTEKLESSMSGFESCLQKSGVIKDNKVVQGAIYPAPVDEQFSGYKESGDLLFLSEGISSKLVKAKYDKFVEVDGCKHYEKITPEGIALRSVEDSERARILAEKEEVMKCGDYERLADFRERHKEFAAEIDPIIEALMKDLVAKSAKAVTDGKYTDEDLKILRSFQRLVVNPQVEKANALFEATMTLEGTDLKVAQEQLEKAKQSLAALNQAPYLSKAVVDKLEADGRFDDAIIANHSKALLLAHSQLGNKVNGITVTPDIASTNVMQMKVAYEQQVEIKRERFEISTGQREGQSNYYYTLANRLRQNIQMRTQNYMQEIQSEYARMQFGGHCYKPFRNTQRCLMDAQDRINELQAYLTHYNKVDQERIAEYEAKAKDYAELEKQGRAYVARQNGEVVPETPTDNTTVPPRNNTGVYTFDYNGGNQQQQYQQQGGYPQQPGYQGFPQQQQPGMQGQMGYQYYGNFGYGNQGGFPQQQQGFSPYGYPQQNPYSQFQQPPQYGYWNNPYQAYGNFNMYGGMGYGFR